MGSHPDRDATGGGMTTGVGDTVEYRVYVGGSEEEEEGFLDIPDNPCTSSLGGVDEREGLG